ncbi:MAG: PAS domain-containing protein [Candidatus Lokiarchaeota archaeon]|nr:PAS domain-containing protein [Candidatus Lokiarchaeota archaeon]
MAYNAAPIIDDIDNVMGVVLIFRDIASEKKAERCSKKAERVLKKSQASLADAQRIAHIGNWDWDIIKNELLWSDEIYRIFNVPKQEFVESYDAFLSFVHPDDRDFVKKSVEHALYKKNLIVLITK